MCEKLVLSIATGLAEGLWFFHALVRDTSEVDLAASARHSILHSNLDILDSTKPILDNDEYPKLHPKDS